MVIQHDLISMDLHRNMTVTGCELRKNQVRLSSGYRINRAGDDAAGLAISERMRSRTRGLDMSLRNCNDGMALVQTAESALRSVHDILHRMNALAIESANGTYDNAVDRNALQEEMEQLMSEIDQTAESTTFNGISLLNGSLSRTGKIILGDDSRAKGPMLYFFDEVVHDVAATTTPGGSATLTGYNALKTTLKDQMVPQAVSAITSTFGDSFGYLNNSVIGIGLNLYTDTGSTTLASVAVGASASGYAGNLDTDLTYTLNVNMATLDMDAAGNLTADSRKELEATIAHEMMHALMDEAHTSGMLGKDEDWGAVAPFPDWFVEGMAQTTGGGAGWSKSIGVTSSKSAAQIASTLGSGANKLGSGTTASQYGTGYLATMYLGYLAGGSSMNNIADGLDKILSEVKAGSSLDKTIAYYTNYDNTADFEASFAADGASFAKQLMTAAGNGRGSVLTGTLAGGDILADGNMSNTLFALDTAHTEVHNEYPDGYDVMSGGALSEDGVSPDGSVPSAGDIDTDGGDSNAPGNTDGPETHEAKTQLRGLVMQSGSNSRDTTTLYIESVSTVALEINDIDLGTQESANRAIDKLQNAINKISVQRADVGAHHNRLEHKISNLTVTTENLKASESYIRDTDMASEITSFISNEIKSQMGVGLMAQANSNRWNVMVLFQGM